MRGAEILIDGSAALAKRLRISELVIALTVVAFGTSAPEFSINMMSLVTGQTNLAVGNIVGSNIANLSLILGMAVLSGSIVVKSRTVWKEIPMSLALSVLMIILANDIVLGKAVEDSLNLADGLIMLLFFCFFLGYTISSALVDNKKIKKEADITTMPVWKAVFWVILGIVGLTIGSKWVVDSSNKLAIALNISEGFIGLTLVAVGTSLPEIATSVIAALKKRSDIAVGNLIGSNIFNIGWVLGLTATLKPLVILPSMVLDMYWIAGFSVVLFVFLLVSKPKHSLKKWHGVTLLMLYLVFLYFLYIGQIK